jgi:hypothetical protein
MYSEYSVLEYSVIMYCTLHVLAWYIKIRYCTSTVLLLASNTRVLVHNKKYDCDFGTIILLYCTLGSGTGLSGYQLYGSGYKAIPG